MRQKRSLAVIWVCLLFLGILIQVEISWLYSIEIKYQGSIHKAQEARLYYEQYENIWKDLKYFPIPLSTLDPKAQISFDNSWLFERSYGGSYAHEGIDLMPDANVANRYPIISMTDGRVEKIGWLEKGGYRIGVRSPGDVYVYYAHLSSYAKDFRIGDVVKAGELLGFMGDSGYGPEGTTGMFDVHLHVGLYLRFEEIEELAVNPYWFLKYLEDHKLSYAYE